MKLVATLLIRDEIDVVESTLKFHLAQGAELIIATDNGSVDGTAELLQRYVDAGWVELHHQPDHDYRQSEWVTAMARRAAEVHGADWVINIDADEFWVPKNRKRRLVDVLAEIPAEAGKVKARRTDMIGFPYLEGRPWQRRLVWRNMKTLNEIGKPLTPKMCHRGDPDVTVPQGNHGADGPLLGELAERRPLDIYHVPRRSWEQYRSKIDNGGSAYANNKDLPEVVGWHWRAEYQRLQDGTLRKQYRKQCLSLRWLIKGLREKTLVRDKWLAKELARVDALFQLPS